MKPHPSVADWLEGCRH